MSLNTILNEKFSSRLPVQHLDNWHQMHAASTWEGLLEMKRVQRNSSDNRNGFNGKDQTSFVGKLKRNLVVKLINNKFLEQANTSK